MDKLIATWTEEIDAEVEYRLANWQDYGFEEKPTLDQLRQSIWQDQDHWDREWSDLIADLTEILREINPQGFWKAAVENFGWRALNGEKIFQALDGRAFLAAILPNTDCHFKIYRAKKLIKINNAHHDSPAWNEWYTLKPISAAQYYRLRE